MKVRALVAAVTSVALGSVVLGASPASAEAAAPVALGQPYPYFLDEAGSVGSVPQRAQHPVFEQHRIGVYSYGWEGAPTEVVTRWWRCPVDVSQDPRAGTGLTVDLLAELCVELGTGAELTIPAATIGTLVLPSLTATNDTGTTSVVGYGVSPVEPWAIGSVAVTASPQSRAVAFSFGALGLETGVALTFDGVTRDVVRPMEGRPVGVQTVPGLVPGSAHTWSVVPYREVHGLRLLGPVATGTTRAGFLPPATPTSVRLTWRPGGVAVLTWKQVSTPWAPAIGWQVGLNNPRRTVRAWTPRFRFVWKKVGVPFVIYLKATGRAGGQKTVVLRAKRPR